MHTDLDASCNEDVEVVEDVFGERVFALFTLSQLRSGLVHHDGWNFGSRRDEVEGWHGTGRVGGHHLW